MRKLASGATFALATAAAAMAQTDTATGGLFDNLTGLLGGGLVGIVVLAAIVFFAWRWWFSGD
ncbi:MAG: hypothetical protein HZB38_00775 [Planctomycetes bacterium]|nr:hypothetical protein [Planctomycetota bacterium]